MLPPFPALTEPDEFRVLGIDTSLRSTGLGVVGGRGSALRALWHGTVRVPPQKPLSQCLLALRDGITAALDALSPAAVAIEGIFFCKFAKTALLLGHARGVAIACCAEAGLPVYEYEPRRVKQAVTGHGAASKEQMQHMMMSMLHLDKLPPEDEGDALALAVCHLHSTTGVAALMPEPL
jgi:crossover junction endodeoxyribonuclease RuvC